ncbi:hypothetical protein GT037_009590 [Alternaria burnsii]|uniref:Heterokaryon incompatibility domain-containing protein n=1 Tax=Alternaria burnsii TaxID=1187904 RepID=A0A8H7B045_9PLEO|nr:uncharacterized protein GT037_009590 [Alternaria burnsii]KAF7672559.1 hypothetical protein GT037_009590 [Alternaria burnsii]
MMAEYQHRPLDITTDQIRLVQLLPGDDEPLHVKIIICPITEKAFTALSYTWGSPDPSHAIECEGETIRIMPNLHRFLQLLRRSGHLEPLWFDYLCVDQRNLEERTHFVSIMATIYHAAQQTLCWIGDENVTPLQDLISKTHEMVDYKGAMIQCLSEVDILHSRYRIVERDLEVCGKEVKMLDSSIWHNLNAFLNHGYFDRFVKFCSQFSADLLSSRLWIIQDIVCSRNPAIFGLEVDIPWSELAKSLLALLLLSTKSQPRSPAAMFVVLCEAMRCGYSEVEGKRMELVDLLLALRTRPCRCSDSRDYVYSAYSIATVTSPGQSPGIDYRMTPEAVFSRASQHLNHLSSQPLSLSLTDNIHSRLPSWSTNWEARTERFLLNHPASNFSASRRPNAGDSSVEPVVSAGKMRAQRMRCNGFIVDAIRRTSDYLPPRHHCDHYDVNDHCFFFANWYEFATDNLNLPENDVLLYYADTIQARGCGHVWENAEITPQDRMQKARAFLDFLSSEDADESDLTNSVRLFHAACFPSHDRRFAITRKDRFCLVPKNTQSGDLVCIPHNSRVPYIFRPRTEGGGFINIGETYVHGMMQGQSSEPKDWEEKEFSLY